MAVKTYPNGLGGAADDVASAANFHLSGTAASVYYVDSVTGSGSNSGLDRSVPKATLAQAVTAVSTNDDCVIVLMSTHSEEISTQVTLGQRTYLVGEGTSAGKPAPVLILAHASNDMLNAAASGSEIRNVQFRSGGSAGTPTANAGNLLEVSVANVAVRGCYFDLSSYTDGPGVSVTASAAGTILSGCSFVMSTTGVSREGLLINSADYCDLADLVFDAGTGQFANGSSEPVAFDTSGTITGMRVRNLSFLRGAGMAFDAGTGYVANLSGTENAYVAW